MGIFRLHIRPQGGGANAKQSFSYCLDNNLLGVGWQGKSQKNNLNWEEYKESALEAYEAKELKQVEYLRKNVKKNDLIWTRGTKGDYYLGKVLSGWEYYSNEIARKADIVNIVRCELKKIEIDEVPGKVIACFRPPRTIQAIRNKTALQYSMYLWNKLTGTECYSLEKHCKNVFSLLDSEETEDVIAIYLQTEGWIIIPNSRKADTMSYEFYLIHNKTKERSIVQVKTGHTQLDPRTWKQGKKVFLFQSNGKYSCTSEDVNIVCIDPEKIKSFMQNNIKLLPSKIVYWMDIANS